MKDETRDVTSKVNHKDPVVCSTDLYSRLVSTVLRLTLVLNILINTTKMLIMIYGLFGIIFVVFYDSYYVGVSK